MILGSAKPNGDRSTRGHAKTTISKGVKGFAQIVLRTIGLLHNAFDGGFP
jgi:hypothetical protein